ncbi:YjbF family lipoprotein [Rheinheimera soli]|uniref:YjbF family lipoprotein n=1 Tax=Rheinheimera soli TaxID=443616 RepID=A0ABU1VUE4_9GAMM|nr:YjbF family lipoprotein [Rheinheimera soli]MDR7119329.1 hypothetical protein [Rheinheimera soli]
MHKLACGCLCIALLGLSGCSSTTNTYIETLKLAFNPGDDVALSKEQLAHRGSDVLYARVGNLPRALLVLAFLEHGQQKWISADDAMLVLDNGRLVKTTGFDNNLLFTSNTENDPLKQEITVIKIGQQWQSYADWSAREETGYSASYKIISITSDKVELLGQVFDTRLITEQVTFSNGKTAVNLFWFDDRTNVLLKSQQQISPFWPQIELIHISSAGRMLGIVPKGSSK